jgi:hypothetical protein
MEERRRVADGVEEIGKEKENKEKRRKKYETKMERWKKKMKGIWRIRRTREGESRR